MTLDVFDGNVSVKRDNFAARIFVETLVNTSPGLLPLATLGAIALAAFILVSLAGFIFIAKLKASDDGKAEGDAANYKAKPLLSANELEFLSRLESAVPELRFCPQVAMGALLDPAVSKKENPSRHASLRGTFAQKMIDFVAMDRKTGAIVAIIELDDRTHNEEKDAKRDAMLKSAGYKTVRWHSKNKPDAVAIREELILAA